MNPAPPTMPGLRLSQQQLAARLGVTTRSLRRWLAAGLVPVETLHRGRNVCYVVRDVEHLAEALAVATPTPTPLSLTEQRTLALLAAGPLLGPAVVRQLAEQYGTPSSATWRALAKLVRRGLLDDLRDNAGTYHATDAGRAALAGQQ